MATGRSGATSAATTTGRAMATAQMTAVRQDRAAMPSHSKTRQKATSAATAMSRSAVSM